MNSFVSILTYDFDCGTGRGICFDVGGIKFWRSVLAWVPGPHRRSRACSNRKNRSETAFPKPRLTTYGFLSCAHALSTWRCVHPWRWWTSDAPWTFRLAETTSHLPCAGKSSKQRAERSPSMLPRGTPGVPCDVSFWGGMVIKW